jgi:uncharacterized protein YerC
MDIQKIKAITKTMQELKDGNVKNEHDKAVSEIFNDLFVDVDDFQNNEKLYVFCIAIKNEDQLKNALHNLIEIKELAAMKKRTDMNKLIDGAIAGIKRLYVDDQQFLLK